ncbi:PTS system mannose/fructose/sorbose family transporter subunit IID, partial [Pantoea dispersa]
MFFFYFSSPRVFHCIPLLGVVFGFRNGVDIVRDMGGGLLHYLTVGASILGLFVLGAVVYKWTHV